MLFSASCKNDTHYKTTVEKPLLSVVRFTCSSNKKYVQKPPQFFNILCHWYGILKMISNIIYSYLTTSQVKKGDKTNQNKREECSLCCYVRPARSR